MTDAADIPALDPRVWGVRPAPPALSRAEQAAAVIEELARRAGPSTRIGSKDDLRAVTAVSVGTLNEALALAHARGVVTLRRGPGGGIFAAPTSSLMRMGNLMIGLENDESTVADALRVRSALDPLVIHDALEHSSAAVSPSAGHHGRDAQEPGRPGHRRVPAWVVGVPAGVAEISPNPLLRTVYVSLLGVLDEGTIAVVSVPGGRCRAAVRPVRTDVDALGARDHGAACAIMRDFIASQA